MQGSVFVDESFHLTKRSSILMVFLIPLLLIQEVLNPLFPRPICYPFILKLERPVLLKRIGSWSLDVKVAGSNSPTADQITLCWPHPPPRKMMCTVISLMKESTCRVFRSIGGRCLLLGHV